MNFDPRPGRAHPLFLKWLYTPRTGKKREVEGKGGKKGATREGSGGQGRGEGGNEGVK